MTHVLDIDGVLFSAFIGHAILALVILLLLRPILARIGFQKAVWNPPLAQFAIGVCILGLLTLIL